MVVSGASVELPLRFLPALWIECFLLLFPDSQEQKSGSQKTCWNAHRVSRHLQALGLKVDLCDEVDLSRAAATLGKLTWVSLRQKTWILYCMNRIL